jgi:endonuclease G
MRKIILTAFAVFAVPAAVGADDLASLVYYDVREDFIVYYSESQLIAKHFAYTLSYNEECEQPNWVAYKVTKEQLENPTCERDDHFRMDPLIVTGSASSYDYASSGYSRGHLAPCGDMLWEWQAMDESFYLSNMSPQTQQFNGAGGTWWDLENQVREWARENDELYVVTGPVLDGDYVKWIGNNRVAVPKRFYKVILDPVEPDVKAVGFILAQEDYDEDFRDYAVSVDEVEQVTGLDFFYSLPNSVEDEIEANEECWQ